MPKGTSFSTGTRGVGAICTWEGVCPSSGVHTPDGSICIGNYDGTKWSHQLVKPCQKEIIEARKANGGTEPSRATKRTVNQVKRGKRKLKKLKAQISAAKAKVKALSKSASDGESDDDTDTNDKAGDSFGGKRSKKKTS